MSANALAIPGLRSSLRAERDRASLNVCPPHCPHAWSVARNCGARLDLRPAGWASERPERYRSDFQEAPRSFKPDFQLLLLRRHGPRGRCKISLRSGKSRVHVGKQGKFGRARAFQDQTHGLLLPDQKTPPSCSRLASPDQHGDTVLSPYGTRIDRPPAARFLSIISRSATRISANVSLSHLLRDEVIWFGVGILNWLRVMTSPRAGPSNAGKARVFSLAAHSAFARRCASRADRPSRTRFAVSIKGGERLAEFYAGVSQVRFVFLIRCTIVHSSRSNCEGLPFPRANQIDQIRRLAEPRKIRSAGSVLLKKIHPGAEYLLCEPHAADRERKRKGRRVIHLVSKS